MSMSTAYVAMRHGGRSVVSHLDEQRTQRLPEMNSGETLQIDWAMTSPVPKSNLWVRLLEEWQMFGCRRARSAAAGHGSRATGSAARDGVSVAVNKLAPGGSLIRGPAIDAEYFSCTLV